MSKFVVLPILASTCALCLGGSAAARERPAVTGFTISPSRLVIGNSSTAATSKPRRVTTIRFRLSTRATVKIMIARKLAGRRSGGRCVKSTARLRHRKACTRYVKRGTLVRGRIRAGNVALPFSGRVGGRMLTPGTYRARIRAISSAHRRSKLDAASFTVVKGSSASKPGPPAPAPPPGASPPPGGFPTPSSTGVPAGWTPAQIRTTDLTVTTPGAVVQDVLFQNGASLDIAAPNVTVRRIQMEGGQINNEPGPQCQNGLVVEDSTFMLRPGQAYDATGAPAIQWGGYTARRVKVWYRSEGLFISGKSAGCGPVTIEDSFIKLDDHGDCNLHADGMQGYDGNAVTVRNVVSDSSLATCGTAPFFYPKNQGNTSATIDRLLVIGGGYTFRLGMPATVSGLKIGDQPPGPYGSGHSWAYGPIDVNCPAMSSWDAAIVTVTADYQVARTLRAQPCNTNGGA